MLCLGTGPLRPVSQSGPEPTESRTDALDCELAVLEERVVPLLEISQGAPESLLVSEQGCMGYLEPRQGLCLRIKLLTRSREGGSVLLEVAGETFDLGPSLEPLAQ